MNSSPSSYSAELDMDLCVMKRSGAREAMSFDKIKNRITQLGHQFCLKHVNYSSLAIKIIEQLYDNITTTEIDNLTAEQCTTMSTVHPDYSALAGCIIVSNNHKNTCKLFSDATELICGENLLSESYYSFVTAYADELNAMISDDRDYLIDYFGFKTLEKSYLIKGKNGVTIERPQYLWMRVAVGLHHVPTSSADSHDCLATILETYNLLSQKYMIHATPTLFNAGLKRNQMASCFLIGMKDDSIDGIYDTLHDCARISKYAGGIGLHIHNVRGSGSHILGTNGQSNGIVPMLQVFNSSAKYVDQGGGKRAGSIAIYLEPWHSDIMNFIDLKRNHGAENMRARDLFYAMWVPDLFMKRVESSGKWSLFCPNKCPHLSDVFGDEFEALYTKYENEGLAIETVNARDVWTKIISSQIETGMPYLLFKDAVNRKSNQMNIGVIKSSNLCCEIVQHTSPTETAVCNLASIALSSFVKYNSSSVASFDFTKLHAVVKTAINNLNRVVDINYYPTPECKESNFRHRPVGLGIQGLADTFILMDMAFESAEARQLNLLISETIYHAALEQSNEMAIARKQVFGELFRIGKQRDSCVPIGCPYTQAEQDNLDEDHCGAYSSFIGSPLSHGIFQFDFDGNTPPDNSRYNWDELRESIRAHGVRNSLLVALMPTASTAQIIGCNECFEPFTSNIYSRRTKSGTFIVINKYMIQELIDLGLWNNALKNNIIEHNGSIQHITSLSQHIRDKYKTAWEIKMKSVIDLCSDRGRFVDQSQSMNLWKADPTYSDLTSMHFYSWKKGLKTGMYYLRRKSPYSPQQFTVEPTTTTVTTSAPVEECLMCSA